MRRYFLSTHSRIHTTSSLAAVTWVPTSVVKLAMTPFAHGATSGSRPRRITAKAAVFRRSTSPIGNRTKLVNVFADFFPQPDPDSERGRCQVNRIRNDRRSWLEPPRSGVRAGRSGFGGVAGRPGEGPFTIRFPDFRYGVSRMQPTPFQTDGVDGPSRQLSAKMVIVEDHQEGSHPMSAVIADETDLRLPASARSSSRVFAVKFAAIDLRVAALGAEIVARTTAVAIRHAAVPACANM